MMAVIAGQWERDNISPEHKRRSKKTRFVSEPWKKPDVAPSFTLNEHFYLYFMSI